MGAEYWMEQHYRVLKFSFSILRLLNTPSLIAAVNASHKVTGMTQAEDLDLNFGEAHGWTVFFQSEMITALDGFVWQRVSILKHATRTLQALWYSDTLKYHKQ